MQDKVYVNKNLIYSIIVGIVIGLAVYPVSVVFGVFGPGSYFIFLIATWLGLYVLVSANYLRCLKQYFFVVVISSFLSTFIVLLFIVWVLMNYGVFS